MSTTGNGNIVILVPVVRRTTFETGYTTAVVCYFGKNIGSKLAVEKPANAYNLHSETEPGDD